MQFTYKIYFQDGGEKFIFKVAWILLKNEPKCFACSSKAYTKRIKNLASGVYSSFSNFTDTNEQRIQFTITYFVTLFNRLKDNKKEGERKVCGKLYHS